MIIYKYLSFCVITFFLHIVTAKEFGIALYPEDTVFYNNCISAADRMMYYDVDSAEVCAKLALGLAKKHTNPIWKAEAYNRLGVTNWFKGDYVNAFVLLDSSQVIAEELQDDQLKSRNYRFLGNIHVEAFDLKSALIYYKKALVNSNQENLAIVMNNIGKAFLDHHLLDSAYYYFTRAIKILDKKNSNATPILFFNFGHLYFKMENYHKADSIIRISLEYAENKDDKRAKARGYQILAEIGLLKNQFAQSLKFAKNSMHYAIQSRSSETSSKCARTLSKVWKANGNYDSAYYYLAIIDNFQNNEEVRNSVNSIQFSRFQKSQEQLIEVEEKNTLIKRQAQSLRRLIFILMSVLISLILSLTLLIKSRKNLNKQRESLENLNEFKTKMMALAAHDLKSPVGNFRGMLDLLDNEIVAKKDLTDLIPVLKRKLDGHLNLLDNLFAWAKNPSHNQHIIFQNLNLYELSNEVIENVNQFFVHKKIKIINNLDKGYQINTDKNLISIIIRNLLINSVKFSHNNSKVILRGELSLNFLTISIKDFGVGIPVNELPKLFTVDSYRRKGTEDEEGSGIGLALCKELLKKLNGKIWAESNLNKGSIFHVRIPQ